MSNQETRKQRTGESQKLQVGRPLRWTPPFRRAEDCSLYLLVRDRDTRRTGKMNNFEAIEADFAAPFFKIGGRIIKRVAEFDQHV